MLWIFAVSMVVPPSPAVLASPVPFSALAEGALAPPPLVELLGAVLGSADVAVSAGLVEGAAPAGAVPPALAVVAVPMGASAVVVPSAGAAKPAGAIIIMGATPCGISGIAPPAAALGAMPAGVTPAAMPPAAGDAIAPAIGAPGMA